MQREFTDADLIETLKEGLWYQYLKYPVIQGYLEFDDLLQDCLLDWYNVMKSTGEVRIEHYRKTIDWKHMKNMVKLYTYQVVPNYLRTNAVKYHPLSLNKEIKEDDERETEFIDLIQSNDEDILLTAESNDILSILNESERKVVNGLLEGYTKVALRERYERFDYILEDAKKKIVNYYKDIHGKIPNSILNYMDKFNKWDEEIPENYSIDKLYEEFQ